MSPDAPAGGGGPGHFRQSASTINCHGHASVPVHGSPAARRMTPQDHQRANTLRRAKCVYDALCKAQSRVGPAIKEETGCALDEALSGILPAVVIMVGVLAASAALGGAVGAMIGALAGGVGAIPGAAAGAATGAELGMLLLNGLGIGFLAVYIVQHITKVFDLATQGVKEAWDAPASPMPTSAKIDHASRSLARSVAVLIRLILEGIVLYLLEKGTAVTAQRVSEVGAKLRASKLGVRLAEYVERNWKALVENPRLRKVAREYGGAKQGKTDATIEKIEEGTRGSRVKQVETATATTKCDPATLARKWQGSGRYPGVDNWENIILKKGEKVWGGAPGQSNFYTTGETIKLAGNDATKIFEGLQVDKGDFLQYRPGMTQYEVTEDIVAGYSRAIANGQHGDGGFAQLFIEEYASVLKPIKSMPLVNR